MNDFPDLNETQFEAFQRRIHLVETLLDESLGDEERRRLREEYRGLYGVTDRTIRNYLARYKAEGAKGLLFLRTKQPAPRIQDGALREKLLSLVKERPSRTVPGLRRLLMAQPDYKDAIARVSDRTVYRFLSEQGFSQRQRSVLAVSAGPAAYRQFQASRSMALIQGDARDGIYLPDGAGRRRKTYLFAWVDDFSRKLLFAQYYWDEKLPRMEDSFRRMVLRWGIPEKVYIDNGSVYLAKQFAWMLIQLSAKKIHHPPYQAWCKGKIEAIMKTIKNEFQREAEQAGFLTLEELNTALWAWMDVEYNRRIHSSTGEAPNLRFVNGLPDNHRRITDLAWFDALFLLRVDRTVTKYGKISLCGNAYATPHAAPGCVVEIRYDPFDLRRVYRFENGNVAETLEAKTMVNQSAPSLPAETTKSDGAVSREAAAYFSRLRERHGEIEKGPVPSYAKLRGDRV